MLSKIDRTRFLQCFFNLNFAFLKSVCSCLRRKADEAPRRTQEKNVWYPGEADEETELQQTCLTANMFCQSLGPCYIEVIVNYVHCLSQC